MSNRTYPHWAGIQKMSTAFGRKTPLKYRKCAICLLDATRVGTVQYGFSRSDDEYFGLCPSNDCRDQLKTRECAIPRWQSSADRGEPR